MCKGGHLPTLEFFQLLITLLNIFRFRLDSLQVLVLNLHVYLYNLRSCYCYCVNKVRLAVVGLTWIPGVCENMVFIVKNGKIELLHDKPNL